MRCIDCGISKTITVAQERRVGSRICAWNVCRDCLREYERTTAQIKREQEAKALGAGKLATPKRPTNDNTQQGVLA